MAAVKQSKLLSDYWQEQISAWEQTDQTQKSFCEAHNLYYHRFGYWRRKYRDARPNEVVEQHAGFIPVRHAPEGITTGLTLTLPNGIRIHGIAVSNLSVVAQLLRQQ